MSSTLQSKWPIKKNLLRTVKIEKSWEPTNWKKTRTNGRTVLDHLTVSTKLSGNKWKMFKLLHNLENKGQCPDWKIIQSANIIRDLLTFLPPYILRNTTKFIKEVSVQIKQTMLFTNFSQWRAVFKCRVHNRMCKKKRTFHGRV